jgi:hypothetical protein
MVGWIKNGEEKEGKAMTAGAGKAKPGTTGVRKGPRKPPGAPKLERRTDMYISTLRNVIKAMGGELEIKAKFPDGEVRINQFTDTNLHRRLKTTG